MRRPQQQLRRSRHFMRYFMRHFMRQYLLLPSATASSGLHTRWSVPVALHPRSACDGLYLQAQAAPSATIPRHPASLSAPLLRHSLRLQPRRVTRVISTVPDTNSGSYAMADRRWSCLNPSQYRTAVFYKVAQRFGAPVDIRRAQVAGHAQKEWNQATCGGRPQTAALPNLDVCTVSPAPMVPPRARSSSSRFVTLLASSHSLASSR